jgi:hypothetical protein
MFVPLGFVGQFETHVTCYTADEKAVGVMYISGSMGGLGILW